MELWQKQAQFTEDVAQLLNFIFKSGYYVTLAEAYRTPEQAEIYAKEGKGIKDSLHCKRLAIDLNLFDGHGTYLKDYKDYETFGLYWERLDSMNRWGGHFSRKDSNHFERKEV